MSGRGLAAAEVDVVRDGGRWTLGGGPGGGPCGGQAGRGGVWRAVGGAWGFVGAVFVGIQEVVKVSHFGHFVVGHFACEISRSAL